MKLLPACLRRSTPQFLYSMFFQNKEDAVREFFHYAHDHQNAAHCLMTNSITYIDSAAYLYHHAFEMLFKGLLLYEFGKFNKTHQLKQLYKKLKYPKITSEDKDFLKIVNEFQYLKYPVEMESRIKYISNNEVYYRSEVGTDELEKSDFLFNKLWKDLENVPPFREIISRIDYTKKGGRQLMSKSKD